MIAIKIFCLRIKFDIYGQGQDVLYGIDAKSVCLHAQDQMQRKLGTQMKLSLGFAISLLKVSRKNILECRIKKI